MGILTKNNIITDFLLGISCFIFRDSSMTQSPSKNVLTNMRVPKEGRKKNKRREVNTTLRCSAKLGIKVTTYHSTLRADFSAFRCAMEPH